MGLNPGHDTCVLEQDTLGSVVAERLRAPNSNSGVDDQQSVGSNLKP